MALPPISQEEFLKQLGKLSATKTVSAANRKANANIPKSSLSPVGGFQAQLDAINSAKASDKAAFDKQGILKKTAIKVVTNPVVSGILKPLNLLGAPMRAGASLFNEYKDTQDSDPNTKASLQDFKNQSLDPMFGWGSVFPMKGWQGRALGFALDVGLDPITYASFGANIPLKSAIRYGGKTAAEIGTRKLAKEAAETSARLVASGVDEGFAKVLADIAPRAVVKETSTRAALGVKTVSGRQGRNALAIFAKKHIEELRKLGIGEASSMTDDAILTLQRDIAAFGKSKLPGWLADDIGIRGPGVYFFNSRVKLPASGTIGKFLERDLINRSRLLLVNEAKLNPFQYVHRVITPKGTGVIADAGPETVLNFRVKLANGSLSPKQADHAITILGADDFRRLQNAKALEEGQQIAVNLSENPLLEKHATTIHRLIEKPGLARTFDEELLIKQWEQVTGEILERTRLGGFEVTPEFSIGKIIDDEGKVVWFPHMETKDAINLRAKIGEEAFDELVPRKTISDSRRSASSFRGRYTEAGDDWYGHTLTADQLNVEDLNRLARNPAEGSKLAALPFDLFETDARLALQKYIRHYAEQKGHFAFMKYILDQGPEYMKYFERSIPMTSRHAMVRMAEEPAMMMETVARNLNQHSAPLKEQLDLYRAMPQNTAEEIAAAQTVLLKAVDDGSASQVPFHQSSAVFDDALENINGNSTHNMVMQERIYLQDDYKNIERQRKELAELVEEMGDDIKNPVIKDRQESLRDTVQEYSNRLEKHFRDLDELREVHSTLPSVDATKTVGSSLPTPAILSVQDVLSKGAIGDIGVDDLKKSLRTIENEHAAFQIDEKGAERILSEKSSEFGLSDIGKRVRIADEKLTAAQKITDPAARRVAVTEATFWVQDVLHQHQSILEYARKQKILSKFGIVMGDDAVNDIFAANARRYVHESRRTLSELAQVIESLKEYRRIVATSPGDVATYMSSKALRQHMGDDLFEVFVRSASGTQMANVSTGVVEADVWFTKMLGSEYYVPQSVNGIVQQTPYPNNQALLYHQVDAHTRRVEQLLSKTTTYGRNDGAGVFGTFDVVKQLETNADVAAQKAAVLVAKPEKPVAVATRVRQQKELNSLSAKVRAVYKDYVADRKNMVKVTKERIKELKAEKKFAEAVQANAKKNHYGKQAAFERKLTNELRVTDNPFNTFESNVKSFYKDLVEDGLWDNFFAENKEMFHFLQTVAGSKNRVTEKQLEILFSIFDNYSYDINVRTLIKKLKAMTPQFDGVRFDGQLTSVIGTDVDRVIYGVLGQKLSKSIDDSANFAWLEADNEIAQITKRIHLEQSKVLDTEKALKNLLPSEFLTSPRGKTLVDDALGVDDKRVLFPNLEPSPVENRKMSDVYADADAIENSDVYPFYKSQQNRANVLHELSNIDGHKVDWSLGGVAPALHRGQPLSFTDATWLAFVDAKNIIGSNSDEVNSVLVWLRSPQVVNIIAPDKANIALSDEFLLAKFVDHVGATQPRALSAGQAATTRQKLIKTAWDKSDANKELSKLKQYKNLILQENIAKQEQDPVRLLDNATTDLNEAERLRRVRARTKIEWSDTQSLNLDTKTESLIAAEKVQLTELQKDVALVVLSKEKKVVEESIVAVERAATSLAAVFDAPLENKALRQLEDEILALEKLKAAGFPYPKTSTLISSRRRQIDLLEKLGGGENVMPTQEGARLTSGADLLAQKNETLARWSASGNYTPEEIALEERRWNKIINQNATDQRRVNRGPKPDREIVDFDQSAGAGKQVDYGPRDNQSQMVPVFEEPIYGRTVEKVSREQQPRPTTLLGQPIDITDEATLNQALLNLTDSKLSELSPVNTPLASQVSVPPTVVELDAVYSSAGLGTPFNPVELANVQTKIKIAADILTANFEPANTVLTGAAKTKFIDNYFAGRGPQISGQHREAMELLREGYRLIDEVTKRGSSTLLEDVLIDSITKEAAYYSIAARLSDEEIVSRLAAGSKGALLVDGVEVPFPESLSGTIRTKLEEGWVYLGDKYPGIAVSTVSEDGALSMAELWKRADYFSDPDFLRYLQSYVGGFTKFHKAYATLSPGFHVRNLIGNTFQFVLAGGKIRNLEPATRLHFEWLKAYKQGVPWETFLKNVPEEYRLATDIGRDAMLGSGGGIFGDIYHGVNRGSKSYDWWLPRKSQSLGQRSDNMSRFILGFDSAMQGMDVNAAIARVRKFYFDYEDLSTVDKAIKQIIPFWIWTSRNLPLQIENMWLNPKPYLIYDSFKRNLRDKEAEEAKPLPPWLEEVGAFQLPGVSVYAAPDLNFTRVQQGLNQLVNPKKLGTNFSPLIRVPAEQILGQNLFNDQEISGARERLIAILQGVVVPAARTDNLLNSYGKAKTNAWLGFFGSPVKDN
jgi:hypothetical protein